MHDSSKSGFEVTKFAACFPFYLPDGKEIENTISLDFGAVIGPEGYILTLRFIQAYGNGKATSEKIAGAQKAIMEQRHFNAPGRKVAGYIMIPVFGAHK